jgi:thimet oligopeptidase
MKKTFVIAGTVAAIIGGYMLLYHASPITCKDLPSMNLHIKSAEEVRLLFPRTPQEIEARARCSMESAKKALAELLAIKPEERNFENTALALDRISALSEFPVAANIIEIIEYVHPDEKMRNAAHEQQIKMKEFFVDTIANNKELYKAFKEYVDRKSVSLRPDQEYYIKETMAEFKRAGLDLPDDILEKVKNVQKTLAALTTEFEANIAADNRTIQVKADELLGLDEDFINSLKRTPEGLYILGLDYPTYFTVMENCTVSETRKKLYVAFQNRGYPINDSVLKNIIAKRDELARLLGFTDYAALDIDAEMAKTPDRVRQFLQGLFVKTSMKADEEYAQLKQDLPESVSLNQDNKFNPWDTAFVKNYYKKQHLQVDEQQLSEYFPMEHTIKGLLDIYEQFLSIRFEQLHAQGFWHEDVQLIATYSKDDNQLLGYLLLDLYPRPNKYSHACHATLIPSVKFENGTLWPQVSIVIANFPKSTATKPSLLKRNDVSTFFHEFGHAMHALLGRAYLASQAGTSVKRDFVEMPSQMLEEWLWDTNILKMVSKHYKTGESLPDALIENIKKLKHFDSGDWAQRQVYLSFMALSMFEAGAQKDPYEIQKKLYTSLRPHVTFYPEDHMYASFGHLTGYAARYYGYLWSKVFALDLFAYIKEHGLLNPVVGQRYIHEVIGKGGSQDPNQLLKNFLGREPNDKAFLADLGLS